jgi:hypothetical protein
MHPTKNSEGIELEHQFVQLEQRVSIKHLSIVACSNQTLFDMLHGTIYFMLVLYIKHYTMQRAQPFQSLNGF